MQSHNRTVGAFRTVVESFVVERAPAPAKRDTGRRVPPVTPPPESESESLGGLYIISVAARILSMHPQTLRKYERFGLVRPSRTVGMLRLYSEQDIIKLRIIKRLVDELRLNLAGVEMALMVFDRLAAAYRERQAGGAAVAAQAFDRMFEQIMDILLGPGDQGATPQSGRPQ